MSATISVDNDTLMIDTDNGQVSGQVRVTYDGDGQLAFVFKRKLGATLWQGPIDLQQLAIDEGKTATEIADARVFGDFPSDSMVPGDILQYGILPTGADLNTIDPSRQEVSDGRFAAIVTIFALLKRPTPENFIVDQNESTGGTFRFRQFATGTQDTAVVMKIGRGVPLQDSLGMWHLSVVESTVVSGMGTNHLLEATPLFPGHLHAAAIRISNKSGQWQSFHELFATLRRTVEVTFSKLKIINDGDPFDVGEADFTFKVMEGKPGNVVKTMFRPEADIDDNNPNDEINLTPASAFRFAIGPKSILEDNQKIGVSVSGHEYDGILEPDEFAGSPVKFLTIPTGMGKETVNGAETTVHAPTTSNADFTFSAVVKHSVTYK